MKTLTANAYAKVNLTLDVFPKGEDGYHELRSIMQTVSLCDEITVILSSEKKDITSDATLAGIENDICVRTAKAFCDAFLSKPLGIHIGIKKNIPISAGLGGGSSDGAAVIKLLAREFGIEDKQKLIEISRKIGSDLPFFLEGGMALIEGTGEKITPLPYRLEKKLLLVKPEQGTSAGGVYGIFDSLLEREPHTTDKLLSALSCGKFDHSLLSNNLQRAAIKAAPQSGEILRRMTELGAEKALVSGSGSTVMGFFADDAIEAAAKELSTYGFCELCQFVY